MSEIVEVRWEGRPIDAFVPGLLSDLAPLEPATLREAALTEGALDGAAVFADTSLEVPARLLLRAEGVASSRIEAIAASPDEVAIADLGHDVGGPAGWVADNLRAVDDSLAHDGPLTVAVLFDWHRRLLASADLDPIHVGAWRDRLGWVGGPVPHRAAHVGPPADRIDALMADLIRFANDRTHDPVTQAALVHAQFETIHPFADGNGRLGRILIGWVLCRRLGLRVPPPISVALVRDVGGYLSGLTLFRTVGPDPWVRWFAGALAGAARSATETLTAVQRLRDGWPGRLDGLRSDAAARVLVGHLVSHPALDIDSAAALLDVSRPTASTALRALTDRGVLREVETARTAGPGRPRRWWVAGELLDLLTR